MTIAHVSSIGTAQSGITDGVWFCNLKNDLPSGSLITVNFSNNTSLLPTPGNSPTAEAYVFGVGVGQLKFLTTEWSWHVMSTATDEDINLLYEEGFS